MHSEQLAKHWQGLDEAARIEWLKRLHTLDFCLTAEELNIEPGELDAVAQQAGLAAVRKTVVDAAGMRDWEYGVVGPQYAKNHRSRTFRGNT